MNSRHLVSGALLAGIGAMYACGDNSPVAPKPAAVSAARVAADGGGHGERVRVLRWNDKLGADVVASATIGPKGGLIRLPGVNAVFSVPAHALKGKATITVRALAGGRVLFHMDPQGLVFAKPATLTLGLKNTNAYQKTAWRNILRGGYIVSPLDIADDDAVDSYEDMVATVDQGVTVASFPMMHFSVVILASQIDTCCGVTGGGGPR